MGNSYKNIYTTLSSKVPNLNNEKNVSNPKALKLSYLDEAFTVYCIEKYKESARFPEQPKSLKAYQIFTKNNPDFVNYNRAALLLYQEKLDALVVESRKDAALVEACKLALTSLISKKIIKINPEEINKVISSIVEKAKKTPEGNYSNTKDWHTCLATFVIAKRKSKEAKANEEINKTMHKAFSALEPYASYSTENIIYDFAKVIEYACKRYEDLNPNPNENRARDLRAIRGILAKYQKNQAIPPHHIDNAVKEIASHFLSSSFKRGFSSRFENYIEQAIIDFSAKHPEKFNKYNPEKDKRTLQIKTWSDSTKNEPSKKLVLAVHGLQDSVNTFNVVANQYVRKGYTVKSYDQSGAAFDEARGKEDLNIKQMQLDFYSMLEKAYLDPNVDEIILLGHSLGGAVIANALKMIHELNDNPPANMPKDKIKKIQLIAPAAMKNPLLQIIGNLPTIRSNPSDKDEHAHLIGQRGIRREGGASALSSFSDFISFVASAFKNLTRYLTEEHVQKPIPIEIHYSETDGLVNKSNFEEIERKSPHPTHKILKNPTGKHHLHAAPDSTIVDSLESEDDLKTGL
ncbi:alpha/beta fold hydrolase [Legionella sp. WA2024007413]